MLKLIVLLSAATLLFAIDPVPPFYQENGVAVKGTDVVAYFTLGKPAPGLARHSYSWMGAKWLFANEEHLNLFKANPEKYAPQYGGFCAWAAASGYKADADPTAWKIVDGRLFVNYNASVQKSWSADAAGLIRRGDARWSTISAKAPKDLKQ